MTKELIVKFNMPGFHCWANAPDEYAYLSALHRHIFFWEVKVLVIDSDREYEFIHLKDILTNIIKNQYDMKTGRLSEGTTVGYDLDNALLFGSMSCEMIAEKTKELAEEALEGLKITEISVLEDDENGARLTWDVFEMPHEIVFNGA